MNNKEITNSYYEILKTKYEEMVLVRTSYEVYKDQGQIVLYCEHLHSVKYKDPSKFTNKTFEFLDLEPVKNIEYIKHNVSDYKEKMNESTKKILEERFRPYNEKLNELLNRKLEW